MLYTEEPVNVLLIEDDTNLGYLLTENLKAKNMSVILVDNGKAAIEVIRTQQFDICILDIMLPGVDGMELAEMLTKKVPRTPFIFLTSLSQDNDKHKGFEIGADDYITKPFNFKELYYRMLAVLRRFQPHNIAHSNSVVRIGTLSFNPSMRELVVKENKKKISHREADLLHMLLQNYNEFVNRYDILNKIWGYDNSLAARSMEVYITRLRKLLKDDPAFEIENLYGEGYRITYHP